jgi:fructokinase
VGEVLWDVFPDGPRFGGAPANFACHAAALGADAALVSRVGDDDLGERAMEFLRQRGIDTAAVTRTNRLPTGTVEVSFDANGSPSYEIAMPVAWDAIEWSGSLERLAAAADAACFGTLAQRSDVSRETIGRFLRSMPAAAWRVFDVNLRQAFYSPQIIRASLELANVLKLNDQELPIVAEACGVAGSTDERLHRILERRHLRLVAMTRGAQGAVVVSSAGKCEHDGFPADVRDTVGAGDAYTAALVMGVLRGDQLDAANEQACRVASYVCSQSGAVPPLPHGLA